MKTHELKSQFGWEGDEGLGEVLITQIMKGEKTATAGPKCLYSEEELIKLHESIGQKVTVIDKDQNTRCNILIKDIFETTFGDPDLRLVAGEGYGNNQEAFKAAHQQAWDDLIQEGKLQLSDSTIMVVELFELITEPLSPSHSGRD